MQLIYFKIQSKYLKLDKISIHQLIGILWCIFKEQNINTVIKFSSGTEYLSIIIFIFLIV